MPSLGRMRSMVQGQGGSTLIELLVALPAALVVMFAAMAAYEHVSGTQRDVQDRSTAVMDATVAMERMTRELRQSTWVLFRSSQVIEAETVVRQGGGPAQRRYVRIQCNEAGPQGGVCHRHEGPPVAYPPPPDATVTRSQLLFTGLHGLDVFHPQRIDPATGRALTNFAAPDYLKIRLRLRAGTGRRVLELRDGIALRNRPGETG